MELMVKPWRFLLVACLMVVAIGLGYASGAKEEASALPRADLRVLQFGDRPPDMDSVQAEINKLTEADLNATVTFDFLTWTDFYNKYNLILTSGERYDIVYSAIWMTYKNYAMKGAFIDLTEMIKQYAPKLLDKSYGISDAMWQDVTVGGKIFAVPAPFPNAEASGLSYREDLRKKHNLPAITTWETLEQYMDAVGKNERGILPLANLAGANGIYALYYSPGIWTADRGTGLIGFNLNNPKSLFKIIDNPDLKSLVSRMVSWANKGYTSKDALSEKGAENEVLWSGKYATAFGQNIGKHRALVENNKNPAMEFGFVPVATWTKTLLMNSGDQDCEAIPRAAKYPERALTLIEKLQTDDRYYRLTQYGVEGKHYKLVGGKYSLEGIDPNAGFGPDRMQPWGWSSAKLMLKPDKGWAEFYTIRDWALSVAKVNPYGSIPFDPSPVSAELAALNQVFQTAYLPLAAGYVSVNTDEGLRQVLDKLNAAGYDKYLAEFQRQSSPFVK